MRNAYSATLLLLCATILAQGQVTDEQAKLVAEAAVRAAAGDPSSKLLRAHRREDLEDDLFRFQTQIEGRIQKAAYFYEVSGNGYFVISPTEALIVTSSNGRQFQLVAVSVSTGQAYLLWRSENATSEFNRLIKDSGVRINTPHDAKMFASFNFTLVADPLGDRVVFSSLQLRHMVEDYFSSNYSESKAERLSHKWWSRFISHKSHFQYDTQVSEDPMGYETTIASISGSPERVPRLDELTLRIRPDGSCEVKSTHTVFPDDSRSRAIQTAIEPQP
jgi:hypothetical protein